MIAEVGYSVAGRSRGRVAPCAVCTGHVETRSAGFLVEPQNQGRRGGPGAAPSWAAGARAAGHVAAPELSWAGQRELEPQDTWWPRSCPGGYRQVFASLTSKLVATVSPGLSSKPVVGFLG
jgi:hypothetical protein